MSCKPLRLKLHVLLHYLVKLEHYNCCRFQWNVVRETSEVILSLLPLSSLIVRVNPDDYEIWKTTQQRSEDDP